MLLQKHGGWVCLGVGLAALIARAALLPVLPVPEPAVHDEFSYLLGAETFASGRLTNPPHPMWVHFETFHVLFQPTYSSKYPPAQALFLAAGWKLFGHPWFGVWLSCGSLCAALCWMLQGWLPPRYALLGGLMAAAEWALSGYWINSYWGGAVAAAGGALVVGAVPRLARRASGGVAALAALGAVVLANSRPYEGALTCAAALGALLLWRRRVRRPVRDLFAARIVLPAAAILAAAAVAMGYYNYRVTGHPLLLPYSLYQSLYAASPLFWMAPLYAPPLYHHQVLSGFWEGWDKSLYLAARANPLRVVFVFAVGVLPFYLTPLSAIALVAGLWRWSAKLRLALAMLAVPVAGLLLERYSLPHYFAPATGLVLLLVVLGLQYLRTRLGRPAVVLLAGLFFVGTALQAFYEAKDRVAGFGERRADVSHSLEARGGRHLVLVRYGPDHNVHDEWVFNHADIDGAAVVWARDMGEAQNRELLDYYPNRTVWLLEADAPEPRPVPYAAGIGQSFGSGVRPALARAHWHTASLQPPVSTSGDHLALSTLSRLRPMPGLSSTASRVHGLAERPSHDPAVSEWLLHGATLD